MDVRVDGLAWLQKADLTYGQLKGLRRALTVIPRVFSEYAKEDPKPLYLFEETETEIGIARGYFETHRRAVHRPTWDTTMGDVDGMPCPFEFEGTLRSEQQQALDSVVRRLEAGSLGGLIRAVPGWGKTVAACALMAKMQVPTLVVVHKEFLMNQWKERIAQFLPGVEIGTVQQNVCDYEGKNVVIGMVHSLGSKRYADEFYDWPGLVIVDECHRIGAYTWAPVPQKFRARWRIGFSATPRRKDGADAVLDYHLGPMLFAAKERRMTPKIKRVWTKFRLIKTANFNPNLAKKGLVLRFLCASRPRNQVIVDQLVEAVKSDRKVIVLSERVQHLKDLDMQFHRTWPTVYGKVPATDYYIGGRKKAELDVAKEARVIFATSQYAAEGLDIPALDTLFLTTPMGDVEQAVGRILRPHDGKKAPVVVDFRDDDVKVCARSAKSRDRYYSGIS